MHEALGAYSGTFLSMTRNSNLDLARGVAALIVLIGHLFLGRFLGLLPPWLLDRFSTGATCVAFFFMLSGYILSQQRFEGPKFRWVVKRLIRLLPVYYVSWALPLIGLILVNSKYQPNMNGIFLGSFAAQSFSSLHYLDQPNPPLWSLSIEIYLTFLFVFFVTWKFQRLLYATGFLFIILLGIESVSVIPFLHGVPLFCTGILIAKFGIKISSKKTHILGILLTAFYLLFAPFLVRGDGVVVLTRYLFVFFTMVFLINLKPTNKVKNFASYIGKRSYCVYAVHWPIMFFLDHIYFIHSEVPLALQFVSYKLFIVLGIEITYRLVEVPAITYSRAYFKSEKQTD